MRPQRPPPGLPRLQLKRAPRARDGAWCCFCKEYLTLAEATLEHVIPFSQGGSNEPENLRLSCPGCNGERGVRPFPEYAALAAAKPPPRRPRRCWARAWKARPFSNPSARPQRLTMVGLALIAAGLVPVGRYEGRRSNPPPAILGARR